MMVDFGVPLEGVSKVDMMWRWWLPIYLSLDVVKRRRADDGEADQKDVGLGV